MRTQIFDLEVFQYDWIAVFRNPDEKTHTVIHNDNYALRKFMSDPALVLGGFNNKHYDNYILMTMLKGGSNIEVKKCNDWIIKEKQDGREFPFIKGMKRPFNAFDLRDDTVDPGLSLKAIEGNLGMSIVESSIPFDLDRPLTPEELEEVIRCCNHDVDATVELYKLRKDGYIEAKAEIGRMYNIPPEKAVGMTNATLAAKALDAHPVELDDEREYIIPDKIDTKRIPPPVLNFFMQIRDKSIPDAVLFGDGKGKQGLTLSAWIQTAGGRCPVKYAWGGVHGGQPRVTVTASEEWLIVNFDVGSLYPNSMRIFGYTSRAMKDPKAFDRMVETRMKYKHAGVKVKSGALKLPINTAFGAMLNKFNALQDRLHGRSVCITNQLAITMLIYDLGKNLSTIDFININTDGLMFKIHISEIDKAQDIVDAWCKETGFEMERDDFQKVIQKDVNNYIGIKTDGSIKTKGAYVSLYKGGNFKTNSLQVLHRATVEYLIHGVPVETTIRNEKNILAFQQIAKTGGTYDGAYQYIDGERRSIQNVNRIYAGKNTACGKIVKGKWVKEKRKKNKTTGKFEITTIDPPQWSETILPDCPAHPLIDNENTAKIEDLDLQYYVDAAKKRIDKYMHIDRKTEKELEKITEVIKLMPARKTTTAPAPESAPVKDPETALQELSIYEKLAIARMDFLTADIKKTGVNRFAEYKYFELSDIVPAALKILNKLNLLFVVTYSAEQATGTLININNPAEQIVFNSPMIELDTRAKGMNSVQALGSIETYQRRYLYMALFDIVEADTFDAMQGKPEEGKKPEATKPQKPATPDERKEIAENLIDKDGAMTETQLKSIKNGLKKLRSISEDFEPFVNKVMKKAKAGMTKEDAEKALISIGNKIKEAETAGA